MKFLPQALTGILATMRTSRPFDRVNPKAFCRLFENHAGGCAAHVAAQGSGWATILYGLVLGAAGGSLRGMERTAHVHDFGTIHSRRARGATSISLASTALGPLATSFGLDLTAGPTGPIRVLAAIPSTVNVVALFVCTPPNVSHRRRSS